MGCSVGYWQSCSGCTDGVDGYVNSRDYPPHPKYGVATGSGCDECKGRGVVFHPLTKADAKYWADLMRTDASPRRSGDRPVLPNDDEAA